MSKRSGIMLFYPFEEKRLLKWNSPVIVQPKLDGERCRATICEDGYSLISSELNYIFSVPHIGTQLWLLYLKTNRRKMELDGELYTHGASFEEIFSKVSRTKNFHPLSTEIEFHVFDIIEPELAQIDRLKALVELSKLFPPSIKLVPSKIASSLDEIMRIYDSYIEDGYEGIIVRHIDAPYIRRRSIYGMKFKPKKSDIYKVTGFKEEIDKDGKPKNRLGALLCIGDDGSEFSVGSGLTGHQRESFWAVRESLTQKNVKVSYQHLTSSNGVPRFPVFVELVERPPEGGFINPLA